MFVYLDNSATTQVKPQVAEIMVKTMTEDFGNPSSLHRMGVNAEKILKKARAQAAAALNASPEEVFFTSCGTESDATVLRGVWESRKKQGRRIITTAVEHPAILNVALDLERQGYRVERIPVDANGRLDMEKAQEFIDDRTAIVSVMWANNETGNIQPVRELAELAHKHGALFHTDAVQAVGKVPMNLSEGWVDFLSLSGHKLHAPKGVGALYVRRGVRFHPFVLGGHQETGRRAGTENVAQIQKEAGENVASVVGLGMAAELASKNIERENSQVRALRDRLESGIVATVPKTRINGDVEHRLPNTTNISFEYIEGESILMLLDQYGICASSGSACTTGSLEPSHVLRAMGLPYTAAHGAIRFSLSRYNPAEEVDFVLEKLPPIIARLREISPYWSSQK